MNEPNTQQEQAASQPPKKMSSRATNFLMMNAGGPGSAPEPSESDSGATQPAHEAPAASESGSKRTGVIGSTIHPAQRPGYPEDPQSESAAAASTSQLTSPRQRTSQRIDPELKAKSKEEKIDRLADRITDVLKKISDIKTGMLNPDMQTSQKLQLMAERSPGFSRFLAILLTQLEPMLMLVQRINEKLVEKNLVKMRASSRQAPEEESSEVAPPPPPEKVSFLELAEKNIVFCDNRKRPLYTLEQMRGKHGYTASEEVLAPMILQNIVEAFHEVAPKARAIPTPSSGIYANIPMDQVMENISDEEIMRFLNYVQRFPRGYVGKNFRITESFAGWVVSGTPDD
jgi:hypothetical protein